MGTIKVNIKWGKQSFNDVEVNLDEPGLIFKLQLTSLTNVPPERIKLLGVKGGPIKDDTDMKTLTIKPGATIKMLGTADTVEKPKEEIKFVEDMPEDAQVGLDLPRGLVNLGNTCYLNSTLQFLRQIEPLKDAIQEYNAQEGGYDREGHLVVQRMRDLFRQLDSNGGPVNPQEFVVVFRSLFPRFAEMDGHGYKQQDAHECYVELLGPVARRLGASAAGGSGAGGSARTVEGSLQGEVEVTITCDEAEEEQSETKKDTFLLLPCHIKGDTNYLRDGLLDGLEEKIEKNSPSLGRNAMYTKKQRVTRLPDYLCVQFVRFFWRKDVNAKAKILRPVKFPMDLDMQEYCAADLKEEILATRKKITDAEESIVDGKGNPLEGTDLSQFNTGWYECIALITHMGRTLESGHYVAYARRENKVEEDAAAAEQKGPFKNKGKKKEDKNTWVRYDDDTVVPCTEEEVQQLAGGSADWHIAFLTLYRRKKAAIKAEPPLAPPTAAKAEEKDSGAAPMDTK